MDRLHAMRVFLKVAETGGFAESGRQLALGTPAVTRAVSKLEDAVGARLFTRTTRAVRLTEVGERYAEDCKLIFDAIEEAEATASGSYSRPKGLLTVSTSELFGERFMMRILADFVDRFPNVSVNAVLVDRVVNLIEEGVDVAIRIGHLPDSSYSAIKVGNVRRVVCASPDYLRDHGIPFEPSDLQGHRIVAASSASLPLEWRFGADGETAVSINPAMISTSNAAAIAVARSGWGLTRALSYQIGDELMDGSLQTVLGEFEEPPLPVHIVHPDGRNASAKVRAFIDFAAEALRANRLLN